MKTKSHSQQKGRTKYFNMAFNTQITQIEKEIKAIESYCGKVNEPLEIQVDYDILKAKLQAYKECAKIVDDVLDKVFPDGCCGTCIVEHCDCPNNCQSKGIGCQAEEYCGIKQVKQALSGEKDV